MTTTNQTFPQPNRTGPLHTFRLDIAAVLERLITDQGAVGIVIFDKSFRIVSYNTSAIEGAQTVVGRLWSVGEKFDDYVTDKEATSYREAFNAALAGSASHFEIELPTTAPPAWVEIRFEPLLGVSGQVEFVVMATRNLTVYREALATVQQNAQSFYHLLDYAPQPMLIVGDPTILYANRAALALLGAATLDDVIAKPWREILHTPDDSPLAYLLSSPHSKLSSTLTVEDKLTALDGQSVDVIARAYATTYDGAAALQLVMADISERKRSEAILRANAQFFRRMIAYSTDAVCLIAADGKFLYFSPSVTRVIGYDEHELVGQNSFTIVHPDDVASMQLLLEELLQQPERVITYTYRARHKNGDWIWLEAYGRNALNDPDFNALITNFREVTERKLAEEQLRQGEKRYRELYIAAQRQTQELTLLDEVRTALATAIEVTPIVQKVVAAIGTTFGYAHVSLYLREGERLALQHSRGEGEAPRYADLQQGVMGRVMRTGVAEGPMPVHSSVGIQHKLCIPLWHQGVVIGVLNVTTTANTRLHENDLRLMTIIGDHISLAVERAKLFEASQAQLRFQTALREAMSVMLSSLELNEILSALAAQMGRLLNVTKVHIAECDIEKGEAIILADYTHPEATEPEKNQDVGRQFDLQRWLPYLLKAVKLTPNRAQVISANDPAMDDISRTSLKFYHTQAAIFLPLMINEERMVIAGMWESRRPRRFENEEIELCEHIARYAVFAMQNARLYSQAQQELQERRRIESALRASEERYALAVAGANDGIWDWDLNTNICYFSPRWEAMMGYRGGEAGTSLQHWFERVDPQELNKLKSTLTAHLQGDTQHFECEYRILQTDGTTRWMLSRGLATRDAQSRAYRIAGSQTDITNRKNTESKLHYAAFHDQLTRLPNRSFFSTSLASVIAYSSQNFEGAGYSVLILDLDRFKVVNDSLGHHIGDEILIKVAQRLQTALNEEDILARLGGDEFAILMSAKPYSRTAHQLALHIQQLMQSSFMVNQHEIFLTVSIGIVRGDPHYVQPDEILRDADIAMYEAKAHGKARAALFESAMHRQAVQRLRLETDLRRSIEREELQLYYQPIINLATGIIHGVEALARWQHPEYGFIDPTDFIPVAEDSGLIVPLGRWFLHQACRQLKQWHNRYPHLAALSVSVNISSRQLVQSDIVADVLAALTTSGLDHRYLKLELTESVMLEQAEATLKQLYFLNDMGVEMQLDDFGMGYSSLSRLHTLPISVIKLDRTFIADLMNGNDPPAIVLTILTLAQTLKKRVIAEGVETLQQLQILRALEADYAQGYYFARPLIPHELEVLLERPKNFLAPETALF